MSGEETMTFRVERVQWADIDVDVAGLVAEWGEEGDAEEWDRERVWEVLHRIGATDLMYSGDFVTVTEQDTEETIA